MLIKHYYFYFMSRELLDWVRKEIPEEAHKNPSILVPWRIKTMLQNWWKLGDTIKILAIQDAMIHMEYSPWELNAIFKNKNQITWETMLSIDEFQKENDLTQNWQPWKSTLIKIFDGITENGFVKAPEIIFPGIKTIETPIKQTTSPTSPEKSILQSNIDGIIWISSMLKWWSLFSSQSVENIRWAISKPKDDFHHGKDAKTAILIPWFLCNQGVMRQLGTELSKSMNVVYPDISANEQLYNSLPELANKITSYVLDLENRGLLKKDGNYTIIGHSLGGSLALLVTNKLRSQHIIQVSSPNEAPDVARISGLGHIPALLNLRDIQWEYAKIQPRSPIERLTTIIPKDDKFIGTDVQWVHWIPWNFTINHIDGLILKWWHIDPILTESGIKNIAEIANWKK